MAMVTIGTLVILVMAGLQVASAAKQGEMELYVHVGIAGTNVTEAKVAGVNGTRTSGLAFGTMTAMDGKVTTGMTSKSTFVGRCMGIYSNVDLDGHNYFLQLSLVFQRGLFNGSTIQIFGANRVNLPVRHVVIAGGTGYFRFVTGTVGISTVVVNPYSHYTLNFHVKYKLP